MGQLHKKFTDGQVKDLLARYLERKVKRAYIQEILGLKRRRFCQLVSRYKENPAAFSIRYSRKRPTRGLDADVEANILKELRQEKALILNKEVPIRRYNYSYIKDQLEEGHLQKVSLPTIIARAKEHGFYMKRPKRKAHDREVLTDYAGQLIQHDSSHHLWAPAAREKWYLITSLDDYSRMILYADLIKQETSWAHIMSLQSVFLKYGLPYSYYVDCHSIFRFVQGRDSLWREHKFLTDETDPQWKRVLDDCGVKVTYALSPQAKGKIERPYQWLQDRMVRTCVRNNISDIRQARATLGEEVQRYNYRQRHSTTQEVPFFRFQRALREKISLFREFTVRSPYKSVKDIFSLRAARTVDPYRRVSFKNLVIKVNHVTPGEVVDIRVYHSENGLSELRFWNKDGLADVHQVKTADLKGVQF